MRTLIALITALALLVPAGCASSDDDDEIRIFAAASMTDALSRVVSAYEPPGSPTVQVSFGSSSTLARQILDGAPADVFITAHRMWIDDLERRGLVAGAPVAIARNTLVCVADADSGVVYADLAALADDDRTLIAIGDEGVPAGDYARQALEHAGILQTLTPRLVGQKDVRAVAWAVRTGNADLGFVYGSDVVAFADTLRTTLAVNPAFHEPIEYFAVSVAGADEDAASTAFLEFLRSDTARAILIADGFEVP